MIVAVVPLKHLPESKSRLHPHLSGKERIELMRGLIEQTIAVLRACTEIERIALATPEVELGRRMGVEIVEDRGTLNGAIADGQRWAAQSGAGSLVVVPADLPRLSPEDVRVLIRRAPAAPAIAIAPTRDGGTGGLILRPPAVIEPCFGPQSFERHCRAAESAGADVKIVVREGFATEIDTIEDLKTQRLHLSSEW